MDIIKEVKERLSVFINLYDALRIVDPVKKKTIIVRDNCVEELEGTCYDIWKEQSFCENCISMRAYTQNDTFIKIQNNRGKFFLVIATPLILDDNKYIVEMLKEISENQKITNQSIKEENFIDNILYEMNEKIIKDELTGIYNKRYINERLPVDINKNIEKESPLAVFMGDIDFFKNVNDKYGHLIGDKVLSDFAKLIQSNIRKDTDWIGRYGGEEFLIVLNNTNLDNGHKIVEKIRELVENRTFQYGDMSIKITVSFGGHILKNKKMSIEELISIADKNLYYAKMNGKNRTVLSEDI